MKKKFLIVHLIITLIALICGGAGAFLFTKTNSFIIPAVLAVVALIITIIASLQVARTIVKPLKLLDASVAKIAEGDLDAVVAYQTRSEMGQLSQSLTNAALTIKTYISETADTLNTIADGKLNVEISHNYKGNFAEIQSALENIVTMLNTSVTSINHSSTQVATGSEQVSNASQALAEGATQQASAIQELSATITEISEQVRQNAANASDANRASVDAQEKIQDVSHEMNQMLQAMADITESSTKINNIIKTIDDIARQTNILALNAAVEAARAGAAGKGFAVVADEVRNLASKSAEAAQNTTDLIESSILAVEKGKTIADETAQTLESVIDATSKSTQLINRIAEASNAQATSIGQVNLGVEQISAVVQTNSATAEQSAASSQEMAGYAKSLKTLVKKFTLRQA